MSAGLGRGGKSWQRTWTSAARGARVEAAIVNNIVVHAWNLLRTGPKQCDHKK